MILQLFEAPPSSCCCFLHCQNQIYLSTWGSFTVCNFATLIFSALSLTQEFSRPQSIWKKIKNKILPPVQRVPDRGIKRANWLLTEAHFGLTRPHDIKFVPSFHRTGRCSRLNTWDVMTCMITSKRIMHWAKCCLWRLTKFTFTVCSWMTHQDHRENCHAFFLASPIMHCSQLCLCMRMYVCMLHAVGVEGWARFLHSLYANACLSVHVMQALLPPDVCACRLCVVICEWRPKAQLGALPRPRLLDLCVNSECETLWFYQVCTITVHAHMQICVCMCVHLCRVRMSIVHSGDNHHGLCPQ